MKDVFELILIHPWAVGALLIVSTICIVAILNVFTNNSDSDDE